MTLRSQCLSSSQSPQQIGRGEVELVKRCSRDDFVFGAENCTSSRGNMEVLSNLEC